MTAGYNWSLECQSPLFWTSSPLNLPVISDGKALWESLLVYGDDWNQMDCMFKTLLGTLLGKEVNWEKKKSRTSFDWDVKQFLDPKQYMSKTSCSIKTCIFIILSSVLNFKWNFKKHSYRSDGFTFKRMKFWKAFLCSRILDEKYQIIVHLRKLIFYLKHLMAVYNTELIYLFNFFSFANVADTLTVFSTSF